MQYLFFIFILFFFSTDINTCAGKKISHWYVVFGHQGHQGSLWIASKVPRIPAFCMSCMFLYFLYFLCIYILYIILKYVFGRGVLFDRVDSVESVSAELRRWRWSRPWFGTGAISNCARGRTREPWTVSRARVGEPTVHRWSSSAQSKWTRKTHYTQKLACNIYVTMYFMYLCNYVFMKSKNILD